MIVTWLQNDGNGKSTTLYLRMSMNMKHTVLIHFVDLACSTVLIEFALNSGCPDEIEEAVDELKVANK